LCSEENKYLHENDRLEVGTMATTHLMNTIKEAARRPGPTLLLHIYQVYQKLAKQWPGKEKDLLAPMRELYARSRQLTDWEKISSEEVLKFCAQETSRQKTALIQKKRMANAAARGTSFGGAPSQQTAQPTAAMTSQPSAGISPAELLNLRTHMLAYVSKLERFTADLAISSVSNLPPSVVADMVGLHWADQPREVTTLVQNLLTIGPQQLTQIGLSSTELTHILNFARYLSSVDLAPINLLVANQKKYEADITRKILAANRAGGSFGAKLGGSAAPGPPSSGLPPLKQTVPFKAKHESSPQVVQKCMQNAVQHALAKSSPSATEKSMAKYSQILGATGVTVTKPGQATASNVPRQATGGPAAAEGEPKSEKSSLLQSQSLSISKKFPHLTISSVDQNKMSTGTSNTNTGVSVSTPATKAPPAVTSNTSRPLAVKAFASLHADSTNINAGQSRQLPSAGKVPVASAGGSRSPALSASQHADGKSEQGPPAASISSRLPPALYGQNTGVKSQGLNAGSSGSLMAKPAPVAASSGKAPSNAPKGRPAAGKSSQQGARNVVSGGHGLVALRDFKAQVRVRTSVILIDFFHSFLDLPVRHGKVT